MGLMLHSPYMAARSVQISLDEDLLAEIDRRPETSSQGRSALIRRALRLYLDLQRRRETDLAYARAYGDASQEVFDEFADLMDAQEWPDK